MNSKHFSNYVLTGLKNILLSIVCSKNIQSDIKGRRWGQEGTEKQEKKPQELESTLDQMPGSCEPPRFQLRGIPHGRHRKKQTQAAGEITETKTLDAGNRLPELTANNKCFTSVLGAWLRATTKPSPRQPYGSCVGDKAP